MSLSRQDVEKIAELARLKLTDDEIADYTQTLSRILSLVEQMNAADTNDVEPMAHPQDTRLRFRDDAATAPDRRDALQAIAPKTEAGLYLVPKVVE